MKKYKVGILGCTGMVGQRFVLLISGHPWFDISILAASPRSAGQSYGAVMRNRWVMNETIPRSVTDSVIYDASDVEFIASQVDFVFCAVDMPKADLLLLEENYARAECPVISNNSVNRYVQDVPMIIPECNPEHIDVIPLQRKRLGTSRGFIAVKSNCSIQSYVPLLHPLLQYGVTDVLVCMYQAISGAGKTFEAWPEMSDNIIPFIKGEEEKSEIEPLKIWGSVTPSGIISKTEPLISAQCLRVPLTYGHMAAIYCRFKDKPSKQIIIDSWNNYQGIPQKLSLPSAPKQFIHYYSEDDMPQAKKCRDIEFGMAISAGRLREDRQYDYKFIGLSHNTLRGAAGGAVLMAELLCEKKYI